MGFVGCDAVWTWNLSADTIGTEANTASIVREEDGGNTFLQSFGVYL